MNRSTRLVGSESEGGIVAEGLVVVEILITQGDGDDPLCEHGLWIIDDVEGWRGVGEGRVEGVEEPEAVGDLAEGRRPGVGREAPAAGVGDDGLAPEGGKGERLEVTVCRAMALPSQGRGRA